MENPIELLWLVLALVLVLPGIYLLVLTFGAICRGRPPRRWDLQGVHEAKIAVIIPAHNEESMIAGTVNSLLQAQYRRELLKVFVVADNCSDATANIARAAGATVWERTDLENRGKGQALDWALTTNSQELEQYDVIAILDADTVAHPLFLAEIEQSFKNREVQAVQGYYGTSNISVGWRPALSEVAFAVSHHLRPLGRNALGSTAGLKGNGMAFRSELILETGWPAHSLVEDLEFTLMLLQRRINVHYNPYARVAAEMVTKKDAATNQRVRWEGGRWQILKMFGPRLGREMIAGNRFPALEALCDLLFPPMVLYVLPCLFSFLGFLIFGMNTPAAIVAIGLAIIPIHVIAALLHRGVSNRVWKSLASVPIFILWKIAVYSKILSEGGGTTWNRTRRESEDDESNEACVRESRYSRAASAASLDLGRTFHIWRSQSRRRDQQWHRYLRRVHFVKRTLDILASLAALILLFPLLLLTAILIWLEDRGPIFFKQERVGRYGKPFTMFKFRSMRTDAEKVRQQLSDQNEHKVAVTFKIKKDPRITRVGSIIRKYSIDEMPQFINVLKGDMSMVGPRPALAKEVALYESFQLRRLNVKPGISCLWQVNGRSDIDFEGQVRLDLEYIHSESIVQDIKILLKTIPAVILARGAY